MAEPLLSRKPLYAQLAESLRGRIRSGEFADGRLPSYRSIMKEMGVALVTVRRALDTIEAEGLIERIQGSGTYIRGQRARASRRRRRTRMVCYVSGTGTEASVGNFFSRMMRAAQAEAEKAGYSQVFAASRDDGIPLAIERGQADGILLGGTYDGGYPVGEFPPNAAEVNEQFVARLAACGVPVVALSNHTVHASAHRVFADYPGIMRKALGLLASLGHEHIGFVSGPTVWPGFGERLRAFREVSAEMGIPVDERLIAEYQRLVFMDPKGAERTVGEMLSSGEPPTAMLVTSGSPSPALAAVERRGLRIPDDISVISFSDHKVTGPGAELPADPEVPEFLTALEMPTARIGALGARRVIDLIEGKSFGDDERTITAQLSLRDGESVARARRHQEGEGHVP